MREATSCISRRSASSASSVATSVRSVSRRLRAAAASRMDLRMASDRLMPDASSVRSARCTSSSNRTDTACVMVTLYHKVYDRRVEVTSFVRGCPRLCSRECAGSRACIMHCPRAALAQSDGVRPVLAIIRMPRVERHCDGSCRRRATERPRANRGWRDSAPRQVLQQPSHEPRRR